MIRKLQNSRAYVMEYEILNIKGEVFLIHANIGGWSSLSLL